MMPLTWAIRRFARAHPAIAGALAALGVGALIVAGGLFLGVPAAIVAVIAGAVSAMAGYSTTTLLTGRTVTPRNVLAVGVLGGLLGAVCSLFIVAAAIV